MSPQQIIDARRSDSGEDECSYDRFGRANGGQAKSARRDRQSAQSRLRRRQLRGLADLGVRDIRGHGDQMNVQRFSAFSDGDTAGNPAGVVICNALPDAVTMHAVAAAGGYSETAFAAQAEGGWRV